LLNFYAVGNETFWVTLGLIGQSAFFLRFLVQWLASERAGQSVIPNSFWYLSIAGALIVLVYAIYRRDPVFIIGQVAGLLVYVRNLMLIRRQGRASQVQSWSERSGENPPS
jgi:lipid-A-disaccharide synthase-like uncharacterized protein